MITKTVLALALCFLGCSSSEDEGCSNDSDCKGDRICESGKCVSPSGGSGGSGGGGGAGGTGGAVATGGAAGCPSHCKTTAGTCCQGQGVCASVPPCLGNPCCSD
ncbi:MAG: hypothetical protein HYZ29_24725 [Myxococcales bacterium]|nr:hypothetical protein [Myxococcales bacterium]